MQGRALSILEMIQKEGFGVAREREEEFASEGRVERLEEWRKYYCEAC